MAINVSTAVHYDEG